MADRKKTPETKMSHLPVEEVIRLHRGLLYYVIRPITGDEHRTDECFSVVCEILLKNYDKYDPSRGTLTSWLTRLARNAALNFVQNRKYEMTAGEEMDATDLENMADLRTPEDALLRKEAMEELNEALKSLDRLEANILLRKYYYMQSTQQIGAELGLSVRAVEGRLYRIKKKLMKKMGGHDHD